VGTIFFFICSPFKKVKSFIYSPFKRLKRIFLNSVLAADTEERKGGKIYCWGGAPYSLSYQHVGPPYCGPTKANYLYYVWITELVKAASDLLSPPPPPPPSLPGRKMGQEYDIYRLLYFTNLNLHVCETEKETVSRDC
jgi:hypothetical protein